ncbi:MAG TPA: hypothetical protein VFK85_16830 [Anaeromyxobacteraceae bacterium]|nr:hypothetical protein [Anaeromyxobacteraceae bacterium]
MAEKLESMEPGEILAAMDSLKEQALSTAQRVAERLELERRMRERPMETLVFAAGAGFLLGGGLWPILRPFVRATAKGLLSPQNLLAIAAAAGALKVASGEEEQPASASAPGSQETH